MAKQVDNGVIWSGRHYGPVRSPPRMAVLTPSKQSPDPVLKQFYTQSSVSIPGKVNLSCKLCHATGFIGYADVEDHLMQVHKVVPTPPASPEKQTNVSADPSLDREFHAAIAVHVNKRKTAHVVEPESPPQHTRRLRSKRAATEEDMSPEKASFYEPEHVENAHNESFDSDDIVAVVDESDEDEPGSSMNRGGSADGDESQIHYKRVTYKKARIDKDLSHPRPLHSRQKVGDIRCTKCAVRTRTERGMTKHMSMCHGIISEFKCERCGNTYPFASTLKTHEKICQRTSKIFRCPECGVAIMTKNKFFTHLSMEHRLKL